MERLHEMDPSQIMSHLRTSVAIEDLLADRRAQAELARVLESNFARNQDEIDKLRSMGMAIVRNPYPVVRLDSKDNGTSWMYETFMLKDRRFLYYFPAWYYDGVPPYLRAEDVVGAGIFSQTFKPDAVERAMEELGINEQTFGGLVYMQAPPIEPYASYDELPFTKPINRVPVSGGEAERYNYNIGQWEVSREGIYSPSFWESSIVTIRALLRR